MASCRFLVVVSGAKIYVTANPHRSDGRKRNKDSIATVRHLSLDFDIDGEARLTSLRTSDTVRTPTAVLSTSLGRYQTLCHIDNFTFERQENTLKLPAVPFGGDRACMDRKRVLRLPGFRNCKNDPPYPVTVKYPCDSTSNLGDFRLDIPAANALPLPHAIPSRKHPGKHTNSEHDWAWILHELAHGKDSAKLTRTFASRARITLSHRPDFASTKAFRWRTFVTLLAVPRRSEIASALCIRKGPSMDAVESPAKKLTSGVESGAFVRVVKA
jgi:RepB DNA-primase from phage plasmid